MKRLLYQIHRWAGVALAVFMLLWFGSGLIIMYAGPSALSTSAQLEHKESLDPQANWLSLGDAWRSAVDHDRQANTAKDQLKNARLEESDAIASARLMREGGEPYWLIETNRATYVAISALNGTRRFFSAADAQRIGTDWLDTGSKADGSDTSLHYLETLPQDSSVRNYTARGPFHRYAVGDTSRELLISARTGEVLRDSTWLSRAAFGFGNWIHLLRPLEAIGLESKRQAVLAWLAGIATAASLTGLIIGWQRWRPGWGGRPTYSQGRVHPYRDVWNTWHFWAGLIGGTAALLWAFSGFLTTNPGEIFSEATPNRQALNRYQGAADAVALPDWRPATLKLASTSADPVVELSWRRLGQQANVLAVTRSGHRQVQAVDGAATVISEPGLLDAAKRLANGTAVQNVVHVNEYDSYYYPRHTQGPVERPLPVLRVDLADAAQTRLYIDPLTGELLQRQDASRRAYRWLYSAVHHWDFGWLYLRPVWDAWMLPLVLLGIVLGGTSVVLGYKRLKLEFKSARKSRQAKAREATSSQAPLTATRAKG